MRTTILRAALFVSILVPGLLPRSAPGASWQCAFPPPGAWLVAPDPKQPNANVSYDFNYWKEWYGSPSVAPILQGLKIEASDWEGYGWPEYYSLKYPLSRLISGAHGVRLVEDYARHFGLWRKVFEVPDLKFEKGRWWNYAAVWGEDEWEPSCLDDDGDVDDPAPIASHYQDIDEYNEMHMPGSYRITVLQRASTIIHEVTHQDVGHIDEEDCSPETESCDPVYGTFGSNTMQINFLHDAAVTHKLKTVNGKTVREVWVDATQNQCGFYPRLNTNEIGALLNRANGVMMRFAGSAWPGWEDDLNFEVALARGAKAEWECESCDLQQHIFYPDQCQQTACNEVLNAANQGVNQHNRNVCVEYNLDRSVEEDQLALEWQEYLDERKACLPPSSEGVAAYCEANLANAETLDDLDPCGWLEGTYTAKSGKTACAQAFCQERWEDDWTAENDPLGCMETFCDPSCGDPSFCEKTFQIGHGDPALYLPTCESDRCRSIMLECLVGKADAGLWTYGDELPQDCALAQNICETATKLALLVLVDRKPFIDMGRPWRERAEISTVSNPGKNVYGYAEQLVTAALSGEAEAELGRMATRFGSAAEMLAALYHADRGAFVTLFGREGFGLGLRYVLGPGIESAHTATIAETDLGTVGRQAWDDLRRMALANRENRVETSIGVFEYDPVAQGVPPPPIPPLPQQVPGQ